MERVNHIYIIKVSCCRLICQIHRVLKRNVPYRKCFKLGISSFYSHLVLMIKLGHTGCHLSASGAWGCHNNKFFSGFYIFIFPISFITYNFCNVRGIALYWIMSVNLYPKRVKPFLKRLRRGLSAKLCHNNRADIQSNVSKTINKPDNIQVIGNSQIAA